MEIVVVEAGWGGILWGLGQDFSKLTLECKMYSGAGTVPFEFSAICQSVSQLMGKFEMMRGRKSADNAMVSVSQSHRLRYLNYTLGL